MRLWSLHPRFLDVKGLTAGWREALLAQAVLRGRTRGYQHHPQLVRFQEHARPRAAVAAFLLEIWREADRRGYSYDRTKIARAPEPASLEPISVTRGQAEYELIHLRAKLQRRDPARMATLPSKTTARDLHPLFKLVSGPVASWEKT